MCCNWGDEVISMNMMEIVNRLQIFSRKRLRALSTAAGRATWGQQQKPNLQKGWVWSKSRHRLLSVVWRLLGRFPRSRWCQQHFVVCLRTTHSIAERRQRGAGQNGSAAVAENGKDRGCLRAATAKLHLGNNSWRLLYELVLTCLP